MLNETFYLDGIDARSAGIQLQAPIEFSEAVPIFEAQTIPGRNGDLIWETGSYENRSGSASCFPTITGWQGWKIVRRFRCGYGLFRRLISVLTANRKDF